MECKPLQTAHAAGVQTTRPVVRLCRLQRLVVYAACTACCTPLPPARLVVYAACTVCCLCRLHGLLYVSAACNGLWSLPLARPVVRLCRLQRPVVYAACTACGTPLPLATACGLCRCTACGTPLSLATACGLCRLHGLLYASVTCNGLWYASAACNGLKGQ